MENQRRYLLLHENGLLRTRITDADAMLSDCRLCPRQCGINRHSNELGYCGIGKKTRVAQYGPHFGEEAPIVGRNGSGAIFFSGCNLRCVFCQNEDISRVDKRGDTAPDAVDSRELAAIMLSLQEQGCHNINCVTPSHVVPQILAALPHAIEGGLTIPLVYNSSGYDTLDTLKLLDGIVDIYMPDCKFMTAAAAKRYVQAADYPQVMIEALREMHRQVGDLRVDDHGLAVQGLLVRHLVMPGLPEETEAIVRFIRQEISPDTYINIMDQYHPCADSADYPEINRTVTPEEFGQAMRMAQDAGLHRFDSKDMAALLRFLQG